MYNILGAGLLLVLQGVGCKGDPGDPGDPGSAMMMRDAGAGERAGESGAGEVSAGEISSGEIAAGQVSAGEVLAGEISAGEVSAGEVSAGEVSAGEVSAGDTPAGEVSAGEVSAGDMPAGETPIGEIPVNDGTYAYPGVNSGQYILTNAPIPCVQVSSVAPYLPDEAGHHIGGIFTPPQYPFTVELIEYTLEEPPDVPSCRSELGHRLEISAISAGQAPPSQPADEAIAHLSFDIPSATMSTERRVIIQLLEEPLTLNNGERLLVSVALDAEGDDHLCAAICEDEVATPNSTLWSGASAAPYAWSELSAFGITGELLMRVVGE